MNRNRTVSLVSAALLALLLGASSLALRHVESVQGESATLEEVLYLPSGKIVKRMSLGYSGLLADIYWTRAVQYFGSRVQRSRHLELLAPLLDITTDLDPQLIPAYQTGSIFLSQPVPEGAGEPDQAVALLEKGIRANPTYWRLYFTLGFVHYMDRHDYGAAQQAFEKGSEVPGALYWMKVMSARMAERSNELSTALDLWKVVYETNHEQLLRDNALNHIRSLQAEMEIEELERRVQTYRERTGLTPSAWRDLSRLGLLQGVPQDPDGEPYQLLGDGTVKVQDPSRFPFLGEFRK